MRFLVDEDVPVDVDRALRQYGFGSVRVAEVLGFQTDDVDVWDYACR
jgi:predicted nuclease of predicted toxin-antitoxin system